MKTRRVEELMVRDVRIVRADTDVHELEKLLLREKIHGVPVTDADGKLVGVVSQTDLLAWHFSTGAGDPPLQRSDLKWTMSHQISVSNAEGGVGPPDGRSDS